MKGILFGKLQLFEKKFNNEEMLFMNRVMFMLLISKNDGSTVTFESFFKILKLLQNGTYGNKVEIIC